MSAAPTPATDHPDAKLLELGRELEAAWAEETRLFTEHEEELELDHIELILDAACSRTNNIVLDIEQVCARTLDGLIVKARACLKCRGECGLGDELFFRNPHPSTDERLVAGIVRDLAAMQIDRKAVLS